MNELLQKHGCSLVFSVPDGLKELMSDISREVLREQPTNIYDFIANYLSVLIITREHGVLALRILDDLCDCKPTVSEHLIQLGMERDQADSVAQVIKEVIENFEVREGKEKIKETQILKKILTRSELDEDMAEKVCQVARNAFRDYIYRKDLLAQNIKMQPDEPWEVAAQHTLEIYKRTKPSFGELSRAAETIQAAYRGYHVRKNLLNHLKPKPKKRVTKLGIIEPPLDIRASREIELGPIINIEVRQDEVNVMFDEDSEQHYDPMRVITNVGEEEPLSEIDSYRKTSKMPRLSAQTTGQDEEFVKKFNREMTGDDLEHQTDYLCKTRRTDQTVEGLRESRLASQTSKGSRSSSLGHGHRTPEGSMQKITFAEKPPEVIPDVGQASENMDLQEIQEEIEPTEATEDEMGQEIIEDLTDDRTDERTDGEESVPAMSASSAPESVVNSDVEEADGTTTAEEED